MEEKILPQFFNESGYATAHFGKWHLGDDEVDDKYSARNRGWSYSIVSNYAKHFNPNLRVNGKMQKFEGFRTDILFNEAQKWMSGQLKSKKPFFCYIALNSAHAPLACTPEYKDLYKDNKNITERSILYYAMVSNIDDNMGRLVEYMKKNKLYENTVLVYMTDNGHLGNDYNAGMRGSKNSPWRGGSRVPCFFHCPDKFKGGVEINELGGALDFLPTVLDLCDIKLDKDVDGVSLAPLLYDNKKTMPERFLVSHTGRWLHGQAEKGKYNQYAIQNKRYRLVNNDSLYDIETDPGETKNIIDQHPELVKQMREWYEAWWQKTLPLMCNEQTAVDMGVPNTKVPGERKTKKKK
ncbi:MAG: sulfatase-like hydrolase/transferase [Rikenellaceae bacterium]